MKRLFIAYLCALTLLVAVVSCSGSAPKEAFVSVPDPVAFDSLVIDSVCPLFRNYDKPACHILIRIDKPAAGNKSSVVKPLEKSLAAIPRDGAFAADGKVTLDDMAHAYVRQFIFQYLMDGKEAIDSYNGDVDEASTWMNYEEIVSGKALYNADGFVCYQFNTYSYAGGAHGNTVIKNCVYDCANNKMVAMDDMFASGVHAKINTLIQDRLMKQYECNSLEELNEKCSFFAPAEIALTDNFLIDDEGIGWTYNPYDIAPYAMGAISVRLEWSEVLPLMKADSPLHAMAVKYGE